MTTPPSLLSGQSKVSHLSHGQWITLNMAIHHVTKRPDIYLFRYAKGDSPMTSRLSPRLVGQYQGKSQTLAVMPLDATVVEVLHSALEIAQAHGTTLPPRTPCTHPVRSLDAKQRPDHRGHTAAKNHHHRVPAGGQPINYAICEGTTTTGLPVQHPGGGRLVDRGPQLPPAKRAKRRARCIVPGCRNHAHFRGLCSCCGSAAARLVSKGLTSWEKLEKQGKAKPIKQRNHAHFFLDTQT